MPEDPFAPRDFQIGRPHFGYGSNMWLPWLRKDAPSARGLGKARLDGWTLRLRKYSRDGSAKADIARGGAYVWGALIEIRNDELRDMNRKEAGYEPVRVTVRLPSGSVVDAWTYTTRSRRERCRLRPYN